MISEIVHLSFSGNCFLLFVYLFLLFEEPNISLLPRFLLLLLFFFLSFFSFNDKLAAYSSSQAKG